MKILEAHEEEIILQTYYIMLDDGRHLWCKETINPSGQIVHFEIVDEDNDSALSWLSEAEIEKVRSMVEAYNEYGQFAYQDKF